MATFEAGQTPFGSPVRVRRRRDTACPSPSVRAAVECSSDVGFRSPLTSKLKGAKRKSFGALRVSLGSPRGHVETPTPTKALPTPPPEPVDATVRRGASLFDDVPSATTHTTHTQPNPCALAPSKRARTSNTDTDTAPTASIDPTRGMKAHDSQSHGAEATGSEREWRLDDFDMGKPLGLGKFGKVWLARQRIQGGAKGALVALKVLSKNALVDGDAVHNLRREVEIQSRLRHESIVQLHAYFHNTKSAFLVLEYAADGELHSRGRLSEPQAVHCIKQLVSAVKYMHACHVIHRDLKPENVLIQGSRVKVADFGWAVHAPPPHENRNTLCGTPEYLAPEIVDGKPYTNLVDVWALGILSFDLLYGITPFSPTSPCDPEERLPTIYANIAAFEGPLLFNRSSRVIPSKAAQAFIRSLVVKNPAQRVELELAEEDPWLQGPASSELPAKR